MPHKPGTPSAVRKAGKQAQNSLTKDDREKLISRLQKIAHLFDDAVTVPGTSIKLGWDAVLGLIPIVGDASTTAVSAYFLWEAYRLGASRWTLTKMVWNVLVDFIIGFIPLVGDLFDVTFRANRRNMKLLEKELGRHSKQG
ncbi:DUF4112 domain-containing protein [Bremerella alba]|nr:DUF4112 domain-containing protein [Bremerella alba]